MTPAIDYLNKQKIAFTLHEYKHDANTSSYGEEAADKLGVSSSYVFKTLVVMTSNRGMAVAVVPVNKLLNTKLMAKALQDKKVKMAEPKDVLRSTGYVLGGVSPVGQKKLLPTIIDDSARQTSNIFVSAGRRGLEIEISSIDLLKATHASFADIT
jgi:Cys-tRNA(Pro)/Cys-tRNA(Cys) deacylase